jgi:hypothetical protein
MLQSNSVTTFRSCIDIVSELINALEEHKIKHPHYKRLHKKGEEANIIEPLQLIQEDTRKTTKHKYIIREKY